MSSPTRYSLMTIAVFFTLLSLSVFRSSALYRDSVEPRPSLPSPSSVERR